MPRYQITNRTSKGQTNKVKEKEEDTDLLLLAGLRALGSAGVVAYLFAEADSHGDVTVIYRHHCHLLPRRSMWDTKTADVGLERKEITQLS